MHRVTLSAALAIAGCVGLQHRALAQEEQPYDGDDPDEGDVEAPYDDYDVEPQGPDDQTNNEPSDQPYDEQPDQAYDGPPGQAYPSDQPYEQGSVDDFYPALEPYGQWVRSPDYGLIWVPYRRVVGPDFVPYSSGGAWEFTDAGWMFVSDWNWGWAPFHYGRWYLDPRFGWVWVPGSVWAPAWVDWRFGGGYIGWAPLPPRHHRTVWVFTRARDIHRPHIHRYVVRRDPRVYRITVPVRHKVRSGRAYWYSGPRRDEVERVGGIRVRPIRFRPPRAGVVARVRVQGGQVRQERVAPARRREITQSRHVVPVRREPPRTGRPDVRRGPDVGRPDVRRQPEVRPQPQPDRRQQQPDRRPQPDVRRPPERRPQADARPQQQQPQQPQAREQQQAREQRERQEQQARAQREQQEQQARAQREQQQAREQRERQDQQA